ncbi:MAG: hypothetical protein H0U86_04285 [Chloroflexi bacterium]|nr:hypothetical protein [Chloroflexota bacterium]
MSRALRLFVAGRLVAATGLRGILGAARPGQRWEEVPEVGVALGSNEGGRVAIPATFAH